MQKIITILIIALLGIGYSRAQFIFKPDADDLKPRYIPAAQSVDISQLLGKDWRQIEPYYGYEEEVWRFTKDTMIVFNYNYEYKEWTVSQQPYYLITDTSYTYDDKDFDNSKVGKAKKGVCVVKKRIKNDNTRPKYYRIINIDMTKGIMKVFKKKRWDEIGLGDAYITLKIIE